MCGRYSLFTNMKTLIERFHLENIDELAWGERYNVAPSQEVFAVVKGELGNRGGTLKWGLIPSWAKDAKIGHNLINARSETVDEKPSFRRLFKRRRCLIIADGFYEWKKEGEAKQPYRFQLKSKEPFAFAGLWDKWVHPDGIIHSCTIITTEANEIVRGIHHRMPVILNRETEAVWLDRNIQGGAKLKSLLVPYPANEMESYPVSSLVNNPRNDTKDILNSL